MTGIRSSRPSASGVQKANSGSSCRKASPASQTIRKERSLDFLWADEPHGEGAKVKPILAAGLENRRCSPSRLTRNPTVQRGARQPPDPPRAAATKNSKFHSFTYLFFMRTSRTRWLVTTQSFASGMRCDFAIAALSHGLKRHRLRCVFVFIRRRELFLSPADVLLLSHEMGGGALVNEVLAAVRAIGLRNALWTERFRNFGGNLPQLRSPLLIRGCSFRYIYSERTVSSLRSDEALHEQHELCGRRLVCFRVANRIRQQRHNLRAQNLSPFLKRCPRQILTAKRQQVEGVEMQLGPGAAIMMVAHPRRMR
jgi:hypothetical protein